MTLRCCYLFKRQSCRDPGVSRLQRSFFSWPNFWIARRFPSKTLPHIDKIFMINVVVLSGTFTLITDISEIRTKNNRFFSRVIMCLLLSLTWQVKWGRHTRDSQVLDCASSTSKVLVPIVGSGLQRIASPEKTSTLDPSIDSLPSVLFATQQN